MTVSRRLSLAAALMCLTVGCGGGNNPGPDTPSPGNPSGGETISGGERLGWSQSAPSLNALRSYTYTLYVDGVRAALSDTRCSDSAGPAGYDCSGLLPAMSAGTHGLQLTASAAGLESARSATLTVTVVPRQTSASAPQESVSTTNASAHVPDVCFGTATDACYEVQTIARDLVRVTGFASLPDGNALVAEQQRLRLISAGALADQPALVVPQDAVISGVTVDPDFSRTGFVFVAETRTSASGALTLDVVRYRMVDGALGQAARIIDDLPVATSTARITFTRERDLYVAMPAASSISASPYDGHVLRFDENGATPHGARGSSPVFALGYASPGGLVEGPEGELWLAGAGAPLRAALAYVDARQTDWPRVPRASVNRAAAGVASLATLEDPATARTAVLYVSQPAGTVFRAWLAGTGRTLAGTTSLSPSLAATAVGTDATGAIYLAVRQDDDGSRNDILRLVPRQ